MGWKLLRRLEKGGRADENYEKDVDEIYELDSADDFNAFLVTRKRKGGTVVERRAGIAYYFSVAAITIERRPPMANGRVQVVVRMTLALLKESAALIAPWELAPYNFRASAALVEETTTRFYPGVGDLVFPKGSFAPCPFVNTAGVTMRGKTSYSTVRLAFSYNVRADSFDSRLVWAPLGKINLFATTVCGMTFPPRTLRLETLSAVFSSERVETTDADGNPTAIYWKFFRLDVAFSANPRSFDQLYANVGTSVNIDGALHRLWRWTNPATNAPVVGTRREYLISGASDGERLTENVALLADGRGAAPIQTYRVGSPFEPVDFAGLELPAAPPEQWNVVDPDELL